MQFQNWYSLGITQKYSVPLRSWMQNPEVIEYVFEADDWALEKAEHQHHAGFTPIQIPSVGFSRDSTVSPLDSPTVPCLIVLA